MQSGPMPGLQSGKIRWPHYLLWGCCGRPRGPISASHSCSCVPTPPHPPEHLGHLTQLHNNTFKYNTANVCESQTDNCDGMSLFTPTWLFLETERKTPQRARLKHIIILWLNTLLQSQTKAKLSFLCCMPAYRATINALMLWYPYCVERCHVLRSLVSYTVMYVV